MTTEYRNNASSTLTAGLTNSALDVTVSITLDTDFPGVTTPDFFYATLEDTAGQVEILKVTASKVVANQFTVERGADTTIPRTWGIGALIEMRLVQANLEELRDHNHDTTYASLAATVDGAYHYATLSSTGVDAYTADITVSPGAYTAGLRVQFEADFANAGACSLNLNSLGVKNIKTQAGADPVNGYVVVGSLVDVEYDGTNFVLMSPSAANEFKDTTEILTSKTLTSPVLNGGLSGTAFLDQDDMASDSAAAAASQQSIKAYVDSSITKTTTRTVILDVAPAINTWTTVSTGIAGIATARVKVIGFVRHTASTTLHSRECRIYFRPVGSSAAADDSTKGFDVSNTEITSTAINLNSQVRQVQEIEVLVDASGDFQYYFTPVPNPPTARTLYIQLLSVVPY